MTTMARTNRRSRAFSGAEEPYARLRGTLSVAGMLGFPLGMLGLAQGWWEVDGYLHTEMASVLAFLLGLWPSIMKY